MKRSSAALLSLLVCLGTAACGPKGGGRSDLTSRVMFTANGSYDAQADTRDRQGGGLRRVLWQTRPPLDAHTVTVVYDSDARPLGWEMQVEAPRFSAQEVAGRGPGRCRRRTGMGFAQPEASCATC